MRLHLSTLIASTILIGSAVLAGPGEPDDSKARLVPFDEIQRRLDEPGLRLLDARPKADYDSSHIPGAVWVDAKAVEKMAARPGALTDRDAWAAWLAPLGIGPDTRVLVYDANRQLDAARLWWLLTYLGVDDVGLIDGNFPLWARQGRPVTADVPAVEPRPFAVTFRAARQATRADVLDNLKKKAGAARVIDARSLAEHVGAEKRSRKVGHVPDSCNLEWSNLVDRDGRFLDEAALRAKAAKAGIKPGEAVITHCQGGGRASVDAFVFERLGFPTRNYYLGWSDWGNADETPVATGDDAGERKP